MSDIFLSYATEDRERAGALAASLANHGWTVFWDRTIPAGKTWRQVIGAALDDARSVVVLWSRSSIQSDWVHEEADEGRERNVLIPVLIEGVRPPIGFRSMQAADLADWDGSDTFPAYRRLIGDIEGLLGPSPLEARKSADQEAARKRAEDQARRKAEAEAARQEAEKEAQQKAEREQAVSKRKAEEEAEAERQAKEQAEIERTAEEEEAEAEHLTAAPPATPPSDKRSKLPWMMAGAAVVAVGIGLAVYQPWKPSSPEVSPVHQEQPATVRDTGPEPAETVPEEPEIEALEAEMVAQTNTNVREGPGIEYGKLATLSRGESVAVSGHIEDWYRVALDGGQEGYVFKELLSASKPEPEADVSAGASKILVPGKTFRDCEVCPEMVVVPAGSFQMGSPLDEAERDDDEGPVPYAVRIPGPFAVGVYEVTNAEFVAFLNAVGRRGPANEPWFETKSEDDRSRIVSSGGSRYGVEQGYENYPVVNVSWYGARAYVDWLKEETGDDYRLLTEAEWEYVARAGTKTRYWWDDDIGSNNANCNGCGSRWDNQEPAPVKSFNANAFGLYNVHGNVWEWVADCYERNAYTTQKNYPAMVGGWQDSCSRVLRGGSWGNVPRSLRSADRSRNTPVNRSNDVGFRVARTL